MFSRWSWLPTVVVLAGCVCARDAVAANRVARIDVEQSGPRRTVRIATAGPPIFATYALGDARQVVVDIAEGDLRQVSGPLEVRDGVLGDVTMQQFHMGALDVSRVTVALTVHCSTVVQGDGNAIIVHACNGATDIPAEPTLLASTEAIGVEAFTALAERAVAMAALGPDLAAELLAMSAQDATGDALDGDGDEAAIFDGMHAPGVAKASMPAQPPAQTHAHRRSKGPMTVVAAQQEGPIKSAAQRRRAARMARRQARLAAAAAAAARHPGTGRAARAGHKVALASAPIPAAARRARLAARRDLARPAAADAEAEAMAPIVIQGRRYADVAAKDPEGDGPIVIQGRRYAHDLANGTEGEGPVVMEGRRRLAQRPSPKQQHATLVAVQRVDHRRILLRVNGGGRFKARHLADPPRFVVDLSGIRRDTSEKLYALGTDQSASRVRLGDQAFGVRAVFDLRDHHTQARIRRTKDGLLVAFAASKGPTERAGRSARDTDHVASAREVGIEPVPAHIAEQTAPISEGIVPEDG